MGLEWVRYAAVIFPPIKLIIDIAAPIQMASLRGMSFSPPLYCLFVDALEILTLRETALEKAETVRVESRQIHGLRDSYPVATPICAICHWGRAALAG